MCFRAWRDKNDASSGVEVNEDPEQLTLPAASVVPLRRHTDQENACSSLDSQGTHLVVFSN